MLQGMSEAFLAIDRSYDERSGCFVRPDGSLDQCHTERPVCQTWYGLARMHAARNILETGTYHGYSTCHLAAAARDAGAGRVTTIDPWKLPHLWDGSDLEPFVRWIPATSQEALPGLLEQRFDMLVIDSIHTYAHCAWELAHFEPLLRPGGLLLCHDSLFHDGVGCAIAQLCASGRFEGVTLDTPRRVPVTTLTAGSVSMGFTMLRKRMEGPPLVPLPELLDIPEHPPDGPEPLLRQSGPGVFRSIALSGPRAGAEAGGRSRASSIRRALQGLLADRRARG